MINVLAQVQFDDDLKVENHMAEIQVELYNRGYVGNEEFIEESQQMQAFSSTVSTRVLREFYDQQLRHVITVARNELRYSTSEYTTFEDFRLRFQHAVEAVGDRGGLVRRVGLRYMDLLDSSLEIPVEQQVNPSLLGFELEGQDGLQILTTGRKSVAPEQRVVFRALRGVTAVQHLNQFAGRRPFIPRLNVERKSANPNDWFVLDVDVFETWDSSVPGERPTLAKTLEILKKFHEQASSIFKRSLTEQAVTHYKG